MIEAVSTDNDSYSFDLEENPNEITWMGWNIKPLSSTEITFSITWEFLQYLHRKSTPPI